MLSSTHVVGRFCLRWPGLVVFAVVIGLSALLFTLIGPQLHAQPSEEEKAATDAWVAAGGTVEVEPTTLTIREGESKSYRLKLTRQPLEDDWYVRILVEGSNRSDGEYDADGDGENDISWVPSAGWEIDITDSNNPETDTPWRTVTIYALDDDDKEDQTITLSHELWDHNTYCPPTLHGGGTPLAMITVRIIDDDANLPNLAIEDESVDEGETARFRVTLSKIVEHDVTVSYGTQNDTAIAGTDYDSESGTLTFSAGTREQFIEVETDEDDLDEPNETFTVTLSSPNGATLSNNSATGTINDDDHPTLSIEDAPAVVEGGTAQFVVTMSIQSTQSVTVNYATRNGTAVAGQDFQTTSDTLTFNPNTTQLTIPVLTTDDATDEEDGETFTVSLSGATIESGKGTATGTINDNDEATLSIADVTVEEGKTARFDVTLSPASDRTVTVQYATADGTGSNKAEAGSDYQQRSGPLTFSAGQLHKTIQITTLTDSTVESDETFTVTLSSPSEATIQDGTATGTITDNDLPELSIADATAVVEGETAEFVVTLSAPNMNPVTVMYETASGSATEGTDFTRTAGTLNFGANNSNTPQTETISVVTQDDSDPESSETFTVRLTNASGATVEDGTAGGTINDNDGGGTQSPPPPPPPPQDDIGNNGNDGNGNDGNGNDGNGNGGNGNDGNGNSGNGNSGNGNGGNGNGGNGNGGNGNNGNGNGGNGNGGNGNGGNGGDGNGGNGNGGGESVPSSLSIGDALVVEGGAADFLVTLSPASEQTVTVDYQTTSGSAVAGEDFDTTSGTLTFAPNATEQTISVQTREDGLDEPDEIFSVMLSNPSGATMAVAAATGTIIDVDFATVSIADATVDEGSTAEFPVTLSVPSWQRVTVNYQTSNRTAVAGQDFEPTSGTLTFYPGDTRKPIRVQTLDDDLDEPIETFAVMLTNASGAALLDVTATGTIIDDDQATLSIADATAEEGSTADFVVTLSVPSTQTVTVGFRTAGGTASQDTDYDAASGTLTFVAGEVEKTIRVQTREDDTDEPDETFTVTLSNPNGAALADVTATGTIIDDDQTTLSIADATAEEGSTADFVVTLSVPSTQTVTVGFRTAGGTASQGTDYDAASGTLTFVAGEVEKTIRVQTREDDTDEPDETFTVMLTNASGAALLDVNATGTIIDDDQATLSIADATAEEGSTADFVVTLSVPSTQTVTIGYRTAGGTAVEDTDYDAASGTLTFVAGEVEKTIRVQTLDDDLDEPIETFAVMLTNASGAALLDVNATGTIIDDDQTTLSIADATAEEGSTADFVVTLSVPSTQTVTVGYRTAGGTAVEGTDYDAASGTLTFVAGEVEKTIRVQTREDDTDEPDETFTVTLSNPNGAALADVTATGTIIDDDQATLSIADATAEEGSMADFVVTLSVPSTQTVTVGYRTVGGTAVEGTDYVAASGTLTFGPRVTRQIIAVQTREDDIDEPDETFTVTLSSPNGATLADATATGTITDDDQATLSIADATAEEGSTADFVVTLSVPSTQTVTVGFRTAGGTAVEDTDYAAASGTLTFVAGEVEKTIRVQTREDDTDEPDETFTVTLSNPNGASLLDGTATGTIVDDDVSGLSIADARVVEGRVARFAVTLSPVSEQTVTVSYRTAGGTAVEGTDYVAASGTLTFGPRVTRQNIAVQTRADDLDEPDETFTVTLSNPNGATLADATATGTITDDDVRALAPINQELVPEIGRALAFSAVRCRIEQVFSDKARGWAKPFVGSSLSVAPASAAPAALDWDEEEDDRSPALEQVLDNAAFSLPLLDGNGERTRFATWGCGDYRALSGDGGASGSWDGAAFSVQVGADAIVGRDLLAGVSLSQSQGSLDFNGVGIGSDRSDGRYDLQLTGVHPYFGWWLSPGLEVWGTIGVARGELQVADDAAGSSHASAVTLASGTIGINGRLLELGGTTLRLKGEAALAQLDVARESAAFRNAAVDLQRLRLAAEIDHEEIVPYVGVLAPWSELGLRHDGGDGETGTSVEVVGGLHYRQIEQGWNAEVYGRWVVVQDDALPDEQGFGVRFRYDPEAPGFGPWVSLSQTWGEPASGVQRLWEEGLGDPGARDPREGRLDLEVGYGFKVSGGRVALTPFGAVSLESSDTRSYRLGTRLALGPRGLLSLETERRDHPTLPADHRITLRGIARF